MPRRDVGVTGNTVKAAGSPSLARYIRLAAEEVAARTVECAHSVAQVSGNEGMSLLGLWLSQQAVPVSGGDGM